MNILIAGNDQTGIEMEAFLVAHGHRIARVDNGLTAVDRIRKEPFDAVIADRRVPVIDGLELCALIRLDLGLKGLPVVLYSPEEALATDREMTRHLGARFLVSKPGDTESDVKALEEIIGHLDGQRPVDESGTQPRELTAWMLKRIEEKARRLRQTQKQIRFFKTAVEKASEMVAVTDSEGSIEYVNPAFERITGYARDELIGNNPRLLKSGRQDESFYRDLWQTITRGESWHGFFVNRRKDGTFYREEAVIIPVANAFGIIHNFVTIKRDVTQENQLQRQLIQSQKMEAIGTLAGGIAHDFNNILSAILGFAELALFDLPEDSHSYEDVSEVIKAGNRAKDLVRQILTFSRKTEHEFKPIDIVPLIHEALKFLRATLPSTIDIRIQIGAERAEVLCNPTMIQQILMNLCTNAAHVMKTTGGVLSVSLQEMAVEAGSIRKHPELPPGPYVQLTIGDTGAGIESGIMGRIFDPYFTTKDKGEGTGLGLSMVHGITQSLKGAVTVDSNPGKGSVFKVLLPRVIGVPESAADQPQTVSAGNERILLADDEDALATMGRLMLDRLGYRVTIKTDSYEAFEAFRAHPDQFDLIISDKTMPLLTGFELAEKVKKIRPDVPIIICTGYSDESEAKIAARMRISRLIVKPLSMDELAGAVRSALDGATQKPRQS